MNRRAPAKIRNRADIAKLVFVLSILLAFGMRRGLAETKIQLPWLGVALFTLIVSSGIFALVMAAKGRRRGSRDEDAGTP